MQSLSPAQQQRPGCSEAAGRRKNYRLACALKCVGVPLGKLFFLGLLLL